MSHPWLPTYCKFIIISLIHESSTLTPNPDPRLEIQGRATGIAAEQYPKLAIVLCGVNFATTVPTPPPPPCRTYIMRFALEGSTC
jgi:hypothetical protein